MVKQFITYFLLILIGIILWPDPGQAQDVTLRATVDRNQVGLNDRFQYTIEISGKSTNLPKPQFPSLEDFSVLSGPNTSTSIQFINGAMTSSNSYTFYLMPQKEGVFQIAPAKLEIDGEILSSNSIEVKVVKSSGQQQIKDPKIQKRNDQELLGENLYLKTFVDRKNVFQNQQILVEYKLYFRVSVRSYNVDKIPANQGFWMEEFKLTSQPPISTEIINGITYQVATLRKIALFPTRSGKLTIEPMIISVDALVKSKRRSRSIFDNFFEDPFGRTVRKTLTSKPVSINVKPLPSLNQPSDFDGVVGKYNMSLKVDKTELKANEAVSVKLTIRGEGNLKLLMPPKLNLPTDMEVYDPKEKTNIKREKNKVSGSKVIEYVVLPRFKGDYTIPAASLSYFDPIKQQYVRLKTEPINLAVLEGDIAATGLMAGSSLSKQEVALLGEDIRYIKENAQFFLAGKKLYQNWLYLLSYLIPLIGLAVAWRYSIQRNKLRSDVELARRRKAGKIASKQLTRARRMLKTNDKEGFYHSITQALQGFVCDRLNIQITDFSSVNVLNQLEKAGLGSDEISEYMDCLQQSDYQRYSGSAADEGELKTFYDRVKNSLTRLEKYI